MSKMYTNQKTGLTVVSGKVKTKSDDGKNITVGVQQRNVEKNIYEFVDVTLTAPVPVEGIAVGDYITATGFKASGGRINIDTINHENAYIEAEGFGVLSGEVLFANKSDEIDKTTGQPRLTQAGSPKKPHFDITVAVGKGNDRVTHTVKIYNIKDQDNIGRYEKLFANFNRESNPMYVSIVTKAENASSYMRETKDKSGRIWQNQCMSHLGMNSLDVNFINGKERANDKESNEAQATPEPTPIPMSQAAPQSNGTGFNYNLDGLDDIDDLDMAQ